MSTSVLCSCAKIAVDEAVTLLAFPFHSDIRSDKPVAHEPAERLEYCLLGPPEEADDLSYRSDELVLKVLRKDPATREIGRDTP